MKKISVILVIVFMFFITSQVYALDMNLINSIRENETNSSQVLLTNTLSNNTNTNSPGINLDLNTSSNNSTNNNTNNSINNTTSIPMNNNSNISSITDLPEASLGLANILNILLLVVGVLLILLGIAIIIRIKK